MKQIKQEILKEFDKKFTGNNDRGIVLYSDGCVSNRYTTPYAICNNCGMEFKDEEAKKMIFGHIGCKKSNGKYFKNTVTYKQVKSFLSQALDKAIKKALEEVREKVEEYFGHIQNDGSGKPMNISINEIGSDIIKLLQDIEEKKKELNYERKKYSNFV